MDSCISRLLVGGVVFGFDGCPFLSRLSLGEEYTEAMSIKFRFEALQLTAEQVSFLQYNPLSCIHVLIP